MFASEPPLWGAVRGGVIVALMSSSGLDRDPMAIQPFRWLVDPDRDALEGYDVVEWTWLRDGWIARARAAGMQRASLASPAAEWFAWLDEVDRVAILGIVLEGPAVVADLLGFVVEPAVRRGIDLLVGVDRALDDLDEADFIEAAFGYAHALQRLRWLTRNRYQRQALRKFLSGAERTLDPTQRAAVTAADGVVQIIAPAGSGKTSVLIERVRELRRRRVSAEAIACVTFNRAAKEELQTRLRAAGAGDVRAYTFHGLGYQILARAKRLSKHTVVGEPSLSQWRRFSAIAKREAGEDGIWLDAADAKAGLSEIKLGWLMSPEEYAATVREGNCEARTLAALYRLYEELQRDAGRVDFDDLILHAVRLLRDDGELRERWQQAHQHVLVDEYQDIEPAQERLVRMLAAPHDQLFCVGDEDQTLYAFRRASVARIIRLDEHYPALERVALGINYRCPGKVVTASARLINVNRVRFPKRIECAPGREDDGAITLCPMSAQVEAAGGVAQTLAALRRDDVAVLARTTNALRPIALACADHGVPITGPAKLFEPQAARLALQRHLELLVRPEEVTDELVRAVCRAPARSLPRGAEHRVTAMLRDGAPFQGAFAGIKAPRRGSGQLLAPGALFEELTAYDDASEAIGLLRGLGGFDDWFEQSDSIAGLDEFECEVLDQAHREAAGVSPADYLEVLRRQAGRLRAVRDKEGGIELATIHGAKGRQWPHVILFAADDGTLPHARSINVSAEEEARGEGIEAERRLAYVAFTRSQSHLEVHYDKERPSLFLVEAGLVEPPKRRRRQSRSAPPVPQPPPASRGWQPPTPRQLPDAAGGAVRRLVRWRRG